MQKGLILMNVRCPEQFLNLACHTKGLTLADVRCLKIEQLWSGSILRSWWIRPQKVIGIYGIKMRWWKRGRRVMEAGSRRLEGTQPGCGGKDGSICYELGTTKDLVYIDSKALSGPVPGAHPQSHVWPRPCLSTNSCTSNRTQTLWCIPCWVLGVLIGAELGWIPSRSCDNYHLVSIILSSASCSSVSYESWLGGLASLVCDRCRLDPHRGI